MVFVTDLSAHCAHTYPIHHLTSVTVVPSERKKSHKTNVYLYTFTLCLFIDMDSLIFYFFYGLLSLKL